MPEILPPEAKSVSYCIPLFPNRKYESIKRKNNSGFKFAYLLCKKSVRHALNSNIIRPMKNHCTFCTDSSQEGL